MNDMSTACNSYPNTHEMAFIAKKKDEILLQHYCSNLQKGHKLCSQLSKKHREKFL